MKTVAELIEELKQFPRDIPVVCCAPLRNRVSSAYAVEIRIRPDGEFWALQLEDEDDSAAVPAVEIVW